MTPLKLDIQNLIVFYHVATEQSLTSAAEKLCLSQPTVTYHIKTLEANVGVRLLEKLDFIDICGSPLITGPETSATRRIILNKFKIRGCNIPTPILVEVNNPEWGKNLVEDGKGMALYHIKSVGKDISSGRLKVIPLPGDIFVGADVLVRTDAPEHTMMEKFITLVKQAFDNH